MPTGDGAKGYKVFSKHQADSLSFLHDIIASPQPADPKRRTEGDDAKEERLISESRARSVSVHCEAVWMKSI